MPNSPLILALQNKELYPHPVEYFNLIETHCSWVILTGHYAYKIKKPVDFGFLNYSNLEKRKHFCEEELKRNQALASEIYLQIVPIYGPTDQPSFSKQGEPIEYAVKMREFPQENILSHLQKKQLLTNDMIKKLANNLAHFHLDTKPVTSDNEIGSSAHAHQQTIDNFTQTLPLLENEADKTELQQLQQQVEILYQKIKLIIDQRKQTGFVRQCHGDVHLNNIVLIENTPVIFDCIDFNHDFCWTDTMADLAFITMDLDEFGEQTLSWNLLNQYLETSGDYAGLHVLPYFQSYRAMVRAKVAMFTYQEISSDIEKRQQYRRYKGCVTLAASYLQPRDPKLLITSGVSASGKSTVTNLIASQFKFIKMTSDRERKRQANIDFAENCTAPVLQGLYNPKQTERTYSALLNISHNIIDAGYPVIVDATFQTKEQRDNFASLAQKLNTPFFILYCHAPEKTLRQWLKQRNKQSNKVSEATQDVLSMQLENFESPLIDEKAHTIDIDTTNDICINSIKQIINGQQ